LPMVRSFHSFEVAHLLVRSAGCLLTEY
jgi:hypothetical protein